MDVFDGFKRCNQVKRAGNRWPFGVRDKERNCGRSITPSGVVDRSHVEVNPHGTSGTGACQHRRAIACSAGDVQDSLAGRPTTGKFVTSEMQLHLNGVAMRLI